MGLVGTTSCFVLGLSFTDWRGSISSCPPFSLECVGLLWAAHGRVSDGRWEDGMSFSLVRSMMLRLYYSLHSANTG